MKLLESLNRRVNEFLTGNTSTSQPTSNKPAAVILQPDPAQQAADVAQLRADFGARYDGPWPLDRPLISFRTPNPKKKGDLLQIPLSLGAAYEGIFATGGNGAGKTSGTGTHIGTAYLKAGMGGLILCAKATEADEWEQRIRAAGRGDDLIMFGRSEDDAFNFLQHEIDHAEGTPASAAVDVLMELVGANQGGDSKNKFWEDSARRLVTACVDALFLAGERVTVSRLHDLSTSLDAAKEVIAKALTRAKAGELTKGQARDVDQRAKFLLQEWPGMAKDTRSGILAHVTTTLDPFLTGEARDRFTEQTTVSPLDILDGKIVVCCMSVKTHSEAGRSANILWKYCVQRTLERRKPNDQMRPCFVYADEAQFFLTIKDIEFVTTSRSTRSSMIYLTQSKANIYSRMSKEQADALLACFQVKIWHHNIDADTNNWAADVISRVFQTKASTSTNYQTGEQAGQGSGGMSYSQSLEHQLQPVEFSRLFKGGPDSHFMVTAYLYQSGKIFESTGTNHALVFFHQQKIKI